MAQGNAIGRFTDADKEPAKTLPPIEGYEKKPLVSLKEAVVSIETPIHNLKEMISTAERNCDNPSDNLSSEESASIHLYTMEWPEDHDSFCLVLNRKLRSEKRNELRSWYLYLKLFFTALYKLPSLKSIVWRGIRGDATHLYRKDFIWWGVSSCTDSLEVVEKFVGRSGVRTLFMIDCLNGKAIKPHSFYKDENEILLMPGTYLRVIDKCSPADDLHIIRLREETPPYQLLASPFNSSTTSSSVDINLVEKLTISSSSQPKSQGASAKSHETSEYVADSSNATALHKFEEDMNKLRKEVGGNAGVPFVDLNDINGYKRVVWATNAPKWRIAVHGINLEGFCNNNTCEAYGKRVIIGIGMKIFDLLCDADPSTTKCPMCKQYVEPTTCGFNNCYWRWEGIKQLPQQPPMRCSGDWKAADDAYHYFDQTLKGTATTSGTAIWRKLIIEAKPLKN